jgi:DNA-binding MarR family transcriptional regulator
MRGAVRSSANPSAGVTDPDGRRDISQEDLTSLRMTLGRLGRMLRQQNTEELSYALTSLLFAISHVQPVTAGDLATTEGVSPASVTRSLTRLVALGLVTRESSPADRRAAVICLTERGEREIQQILKTREIWLNTHLNRLSDDDLSIIFAALPALRRLTGHG